MANELENNMYLVNAPAGSGKTTWIRNKIESYLNENKNDNILCITYTNRAAEELGKNLNSNRVYFGTIHKFINDFVSSFFSHEDIIKLYFNIYKEQISARIENKDNNENIKNSNQKYIEKYGDLNFEIICKNISKISYNEAPFNSLYNGALSHDDLITFTKIVIDKFPIIKRKIADKYQIIFIDEYQDTSADVLSIFYSAIENKKGKLYLLGDKMQQIYKNYNGDFEEQFLKFDKTLQLDINYRTTPYIVSILNKIYNDSNYQQKPYKENADNNMDFTPKIIFTSDSEKSISNFVKIYEKSLVLYLSNKKRFNSIGAMELYNAFDKMDKYKFGNKYTVVDVLTKEDIRELDILLKFIFIVDEINDNYKNERYGHIFKCIKQNSKIINLSKYSIQKHSDKIKIKNLLEEILKIYDDNELKIKDLIEKSNELEFINFEYSNEIINNQDYSEALNVKIIEIRNLSNYLKNPKISTQHGVKGESHDTVVFVAENGKSNPAVNISEFFKIWCCMNITLSTFDKFYYEYLNLLKNIEELIEEKISKVKPELFKNNKNDLIKLIKDFSNKNLDNDYYINLLKTNFDKFLLTPNSTNIKDCLKENLIYGPLSAYRLFSVGCSRAKKNLLIIINKDDFTKYKAKLEQKFKDCGFEIENQ